MNKKTQQWENEKYLKFRYKLTFLMSLGFVTFGAGFFIDAPTNLIFWAFGGTLALFMVFLVIVLDKKKRVTVQELTEFSAQKNPFNKKKYK